MKTTIYDIKGEKKAEITLPEIFDANVREDIVLKFYEAEKLKKIHPYAPFKEAGRRHSAAGTISHKRRDFKGHYGKGMSRVPRKTMWRRGTQFYWIGAEIASARGGRRAHPPKIGRRLRKINKKEIKLAMNSAFASTAHEKYLLNRYSTLDKLNIKLPIVIESKLENIKTKDFLKMLENILHDAYKLAIKNKEVRAGKGKLRGRKYKSNAGLLLIKSKDEKIKIKGIDIKSSSDLSITDLYPLGRLAMFTEKALHELGHESAHESKHELGGKQK